MAVTEPHDQHAAARGGGARSPAGPTGQGLDRRLRAADPLAGALSDDTTAVLVRRLAGHRPPAERLDRHPRLGDRRGGHQRVSAQLRS